MINKLLKILMAFLAVFVGLYPFRYFFGDRNCSGRQMQLIPHDMKFQILLALILFLTPGKKSNAQPWTGTWKGTSLCQVKNSPCHDEVVVFYISQIGGSDTYQIDGKRIVEGKEEDMGILTFLFDPKQKLLVMVDNVKNIRWEFKIAGKQMHGTLVVKGDLRRVIELKKEN